MPGIRNNDVRDRKIKETMNNSKENREEKDTRERHSAVGIKNRKQNTWSQIKPYLIFNFFIVGRF